MPLKLSFQDLVSDPMRFGLAFLPKYFSSSPAPFHTEMAGIIASPHRKVAIAAPRAHAKSTMVCLSDPIRRALSDGPDHYPSGTHRQLICSATAGFAGGWLKKIADELMSNSLIRGAWSIKPTTPWRESEEINFLVNGKPKVIFAKGAGSQVRGMHFDNIAMDDLEDLEQVRSETQRNDLADWFYATLVGSMESHTTVRDIGTLIHHYCLLATLVGDPTSGRPPKANWYTKVYSAILSGRLEDESCEVLWPGKCSREFLLSQRLDMGHVRFARELLNDPAPDEATVFREAWFQKRYYSSPPPLTAMSVCMFLDPNGGEGSNRHRPNTDLDYAAIAVMGVVKHQPDLPQGIRPGDIYLLDVVRGKWDFLKMLDECFAVYQKWRVTSFFYEGAAFQAIVGQAFSQYCSEKGFYPAVMKMDAINSKESRARSVSNLCEQGKVWLPETLPMHTRQEFFSFPIVDHDDQVDAFVGALRGIRQFSELWGDQKNLLPDENRIAYNENTGVYPIIEELRKENPKEWGFEPDGSMHSLKKDEPSVGKWRKDLLE